MREDADGQRAHELTAVPSVSAACALRSDCVGLGAVCRPHGVPAPVERRLGESDRQSIKAHGAG